MLNLPKGYVFKYNFIDLYINIQFIKKNSKVKQLFHMYLIATIINYLKAIIRRLSEDRFS